MLQTKNISVYHDVDNQEVYKIRHQIFQYKTSRIR